MKRAKLLTFMACVTFALYACSVSTTYQERVNLPEGTTSAKADEIVMFNWNDNFVQKLTQKFPDFDPVKFPAKYGISVRRGFLKPLTEGGKEEVFLQIIMNCAVRLENAKEIVQYAKSIVEEGLRQYLSREPSKANVS